MWPIAAHRSFRLWMPTRNKWPWQHCTNPKRKLANCVLHKLGQLRWKLLKSPTTVHLEYLLSWCSTPTRAWATPRISLRPSTTPMPRVCSTISKTKVTVFTHLNSTSMAFIPCPAIVPHMALTTAVAMMWVLQRWLVTLSPRPETKSIGASMTTMATAMPMCASWFMPVLVRHKLPTLCPMLFGHASGASRQEPITVTALVP